jgi:hypothetical protein
MIQKVPSMNPAPAPPNLDIVPMTAFQRRVDQEFTVFIDPQAHVCYLDLFDRHVTSIPPMLNEGTLSVRGISDALFYTFLNRGIPIPPFITVLFRSERWQLASLTVFSIPAHIEVIRS